jgi:hypothetical protein
VTFDTPGNTGAAGVVVAVRQTELESVRPVAEYFVLTLKRYVVCDDKPLTVKLLVNDPDESAVWADPVNAWEQLPGSYVITNPSQTPLDCGTLQLTVTLESAARPSP